jgi:hypothetical protein
MFDTVYGTKYVTPTFIHYGLTRNRFPSCFVS